MDKDMREMFELIINKLDQHDAKFERVDEQFRDLRIYMENNIESRIEALFDGYKQVHEKQWEHDKRLTALENDMDIVKNELFSIKQKVG